jgi:putative ABC transport system permease protein
VKYAYLVWSALRRKPTRTLLTSLSIATAFLLFGVLQGVNVGIQKLMDSSRADHLVVMSRINMGLPLPVAHVARISAVAGVKEATGVVMLFGTYQQPRNVVPVVGADIAAMFRVYSEIMWAPADQVAAAIRLRSGVIVGRALAEQRGWKIGDRVPIRALNMKKADGSADWVFDIVGLYDRDYPETAMWMVANYDYINEPRGAGKDTLFEVIVGVVDPARTAQVAQAIDELFANSPNQTLTQTEKDFFEEILRQVGDINFVVNTIVGAVLFTLLFLTANTMAQSVRERLPELAVLKTFGFTDSAVQWLVLAESLLLCVGAALLGLVASVLVLPVISNRPGLGLAAMHVPRSVFLAGTIVAIGVALASGVPLARKARQLDIAAALSGR